MVDDAKPFFMNYCVLGFFEKVVAKQNNDGSTVDISNSNLDEAPLNLDLTTSHDNAIISSVIEVQNFSEVSTQTENLEKFDLKTAEVQI